MGVSVFLYVDPLVTRPVAMMLLCQRGFQLALFVSYTLCDKLPVALLEPQDTPVFTYDRQVGREFLDITLLLQEFFWT